MSKCQCLSFTGDIFSELCKTRS